MNGWRGWGGEEGPNPAKISFAIGAALGLVVLGWMLLARPGEENVSSSGFSESGPGMSASPYSHPRAAETGLALAGSAAASAAAPSAVRTEPVPGPSAAAAAAVAGSTSAAAAPAAAVPPAAGAAAPPNPKELAAAGVPTDAAGLRNLGASKGLLSDAVSRLLDHPRILSAILNNKLVVDALMNRDTSKRNCSDAGALQGILSTPGSGPVATLTPLVSRVLAKPEAAAAFAGSELGSRLMACPSVQGLSHDSSGLAAIAIANPQAVGLLSDPRVGAALASSAEGTSLLGGVKSSLNGASTQ